MKDVARNEGKYTRFNPIQMFIDPKIRSQTHEKYNLVKYKQRFTV